MVITRDYSDWREGARISCGREIDVHEGETHYAKSGDVNIAYQCVGEGPIDLVLVPGWVSHVEYAWDVPSFSSFLERLASFSRLIFLDRRGTGLSDPVASLPTFEQRMDDVRAVMDSVGSERAALFGISEGGPLSILFSATCPERTSALVLYGTFAKPWWNPKYPTRSYDEEKQRFLEWVAADWGQGTLSSWYAPTIGEDEAQVKAWARFERMGVSPGAAVQLYRMAFDSDVRDLLPAVRVPTLVLQRRDDAVSPLGCGLHLAENIPGARLALLEGADHFPWIDPEEIIAETQRFLTGVPAGPDPDRVLATLLFTDIVGSTRRAGELGDRQWSHLVARHDEIVRGELSRFRGVEVDSAGDGFFARFDGPARAIRCAEAVRDAVSDIGLGIRAGLHAGECEVQGGEVRGIAVHIAARIQGTAEPGEILVSSTVKDLVAGSGLSFVDRGAHALKGVEDEWRLWKVTV